MSPKKILSPEKLLSQKIKRWTDLNLERFISHLKISFLKEVGWVINEIGIKAIPAKVGVEVESELGKNVSATEYSKF